MTTFQLRFTAESHRNLLELEKDLSKSKQLKAIKKDLGYLEHNPHHPSLNTHKYESLSRKFGIEIFEAYAENNTSQAYRIFWYYGPGKKEITIISIIPHP